ncbi:MAG TPA: protein translocase SEC61 complex subunit gamma [archaeon]|nr:protein translocase SEC61 complex subunit gamma [archaeon]
MFNLNEFIQSSIRIFTVSRKPGTKEFEVMAKVTGIGIILIGVIGFAVKLILEGFLKI